MRLLRPPPEFADPAQRRTARIVYSAVGIIMALALGFLLLAVLILHEHTSHWIWSVAVGAVACLAILELNARGRVRAAGLLLVATLWAIFSGLAIIGGGIEAPITSGYLVLIFLAGFVLDARAAWWTAAICGGTSLALFAAGHRGLLPPSNVLDAPLSHWTMLMLFMLIVLGLQHLAARDRAARAAGETALRASEDKFRALFAAMRSLVLVLDGDGRLLEIAPTNPDPLYRRSWPRFSPIRSASRWPPTGRTPSITSCPSATRSCGFPASCRRCLPAASCWWPAISRPENRPRRRCGEPRPNLRSASKPAPSS